MNIKGDDQILCYTGKQNDKVSQTVCPKGIKHCQRKRDTKSYSNEYFCGDSNSKEGCLTDNFIEVCNCTGRFCNYDNPESGGKLHLLTHLLDSFSFFSSCCCKSF